MLVILGGITVDRRLELEKRLAVKLGMMGRIAQGDTNMNDEVRIHIFTDTPYICRPVIMRFLEDEGVVSKMTGLHLRELEKKNIILPLAPQAKDYQTTDLFFQVWDEAANVIVTALKRNPNPRKWIPEVKRNLSMLAINRSLALAGQAAGLNIPPAHEDGMVNMLDMVQANPMLFPTLCDPKYQDIQWQKATTRG